MFIEVGSNIDPVYHAVEGIKQLREYCTVLKISNMYTSKAIGADGQIDPNSPDFLNFGVLIETELKAVDLKYRIIREIEAKLGRKRSSDKYKPRVIDFDIVYYDQEVIIQDEPRLEIPDPEAMLYAHIAYPMRDLDPNFKHPVESKTLTEIAESLDVENLHIHKDNTEILAQMYGESN